MGARDLALYLIGKFVPASPELKKGAPGLRVLGRLSGQIAFGGFGSKTFYVRLHLRLIR